MKHDKGYQHELLDMEDAVTGQKTSQYMLWLPFATCSVKHHGLLMEWKSLLSKHFKSGMDMRILQPFTEFCSLECFKVYWFKLPSLMNHPSVCLSVCPGSIPEECRQCHTQADCVPGVGCQCKTGFQGNGTFCSPEPRECSAAQDDLSAGAFLSAWW